MIGREYLEEIRKRAIKSHVYSQHQLIGLEIARLLDDEAHKTFYMKLAKERGTQELLSIARDVSERDIKNKGSYFMKILGVRGMMPQRVKKSKQQQISFKKKRGQKRK